MSGATSSAPVAAELVERPRPIKAIPIRHWGRWISAAVVLFLAVALVWSLAQNPNVDWATVCEYLFKPLTLRGCCVTIELTFISMVIGIVGGTIARGHAALPTTPCCRGIAWVYIWFFRGTPVYVQIILWGNLGVLYPRLYLGIPFVGVVFASMDSGPLVGAYHRAAILALGLNEAAYAAELVRAGIISVEGARARRPCRSACPPALTMRRDRAAAGDARHHPALRQRDDHACSRRPR